MKHKGFVPNFAKAPKQITDDYPERKTPNPRLSMIYAKKAGITDNFVGNASIGKYKIPIMFRGSGYSAKNVKEPKDADLEEQLGDYIVKFTNDFASKIFEPNEALQAAKKITSASELSNTGSFKSMVGTVFESAVDLAAGRPNEGRAQNAGIDFSSPGPIIRKLFNE